jgi:hypothetical protein
MTVSTTYGTNYNTFQKKANSKTKHTQTTTTLTVKIHSARLNEKARVVIDFVDYDMIPKLMNC